MKKLLQMQVVNKAKYIMLSCFIVFSINNVFSQALTILPNDATSSGKTGPQGSLRYQRIFYLVTPAEMARTGMDSGTSINAIGFTLSRRQSDSTKGNVKVYLQNTTDVVSRVDTGWTTVTATANEFSATGLFPGAYEWQVRANCSAFSPMVNFSNDELYGCNNPYNLNTTAITTTAATLSWEAAGSSSFVNYLVEYTALDTVNWVADTTANTSYNLSGLSSNKLYQWRVRTFCASDSSAVNYATFVTNTISNCGVPTGLSSSVTNDSLVTLTWNAVPGVSYYNIQFTRAGINSWTNTSSFTNSAQLVLPAGTTYHWQVQTTCAPGPVGDYAAGTPFTTGGNVVCYEPTNVYTSAITDSSAMLKWTAVQGATLYTIRYRARNTISWVNATAGMTAVSDSLFAIPDTTGPYNIPFVNGDPFTYSGAGVYVAIEYSQPSGLLSTANLTLSTSLGTSIQAINGQDSIRYLLCMVSRTDSSLLALPATLGENRNRPETRFGSDSLGDSVAVIAVYALGKTIPAYQSPTPISAVIANSSSSSKTYQVTLTVREQQSGVERYSETQDITISADDSSLVVFNGWSPQQSENDSIIISVPAELNENVINNNRKAYFQQVNGSELAYEDGTMVVAGAGFGTGAGLLLNKHTLNGCGQVIAARIFLTESAEDQSLYAVIRDTAGSIIASSPQFTASRQDINSFRTFYFTTPASFSNQDFYIGLAQETGVVNSNPVGAQWEDAQPRNGAYYKANLDGSGLIHSPELGRLMMRAVIISSAPEVFISGNLTLCTGGTSVLTAGSNQTRFANSVIDFSSQQGSTNYSATKALGKPDVYPAYGLSPDSWLSNTADGNREFLHLGYANPATINFVDIYETANPGAVDSIFAKGPGTPNFQLLYAAAAGSAPAVAGKRHISFTETTFPVSEIRISINSAAVAGNNAIDAVGIGKSVVPATFASYLWTPGGDVTSTKTVSSAGGIRLTVSDANGCSSTDSVTVRATPVTAPVITASGGGIICQGDSVTLYSPYASGNTWSNGATTSSITIYNSGSFTLTYNDGSGCTALTSLPFSVTVNALPAPSIAGLTGICIGNQNTLDAGTFSGYLWNTGETTQTISVSNAAIYSVRVTDANGCSNAASLTTNYMTLAAPVITGNLSFCPGGSTVLDAGAGYSSHLWSNGATSRTITVSTAGDFSVVVSNANGCTASATAVISVLQPPVPQISGNSGICSGGSTLLSATAGYASYAWAPSGSTSSITVSSIGAYTVTVTDNNGCTGSAQRTMILYPNPAPIIAGTLSFCGGTSTTLNAGSGYTSYLWSNSATTQTTTVSTAGSVSVTVVNTNGCSASASATISATGNLPVAPGAISGPAVSNCNSTGNVYSIAAVPNTAFYVWTVPAGATIAGGQGTTSVSLNFSPSFQGGYIQVAASNACGQSPSIIPTQLFVRVLPNVPGAISGQTAGVCGPTNKNYSITAVPGASSYTWSVPTGAIITRGQGSRSITVAFSAGFSNGNICVTANNACGSSASSCMVVSGIPSTPGPISGPSLVCSGQNNVSYSITPVVGATSYTWTSPQSSSITYGQGGTEIIVKFSANFGNITVKAKSNCGTSATSVLPVAFTSCFAGPASTATGSTIEPPQIRPVPEIVSSYGGSATTGRMNLEWTLGEPCVELTTTANCLYTEGFHQPLVYSKTALSPTADDLQVSVYPNPFTSLVTVGIETENIKPLFIEMRDVYGRLLLRKGLAAGKGSVVMHTAGLMGGVYYLVVSDAGGVRKTIKLVKAN